MRCFAIIVFLLLLRSSFIYSQSSATIALDHAEVTAGDPVTMVLTFDVPAPCASGIYLQMKEDSESNYLIIRGNLEEGRNAATVNFVVPKDKKGLFRLESPSFLGPCPGYSDNHPVSIPPTTLKVNALLDKNKYPSKAAMSLLLTQKQFLGTKAAALNELSGQIDARLEQNAIDSSDLRSFLTRIIESAEADLEATAREYPSELSNPNDPLPAFFSDFRRQYLNLHIELRAPIPGTRANSEEPARFIYAQQQLNRRPSQKEPEKGRNLSGSLPAIATAVKQAINDNASAYNIVSSTGRARFYAQFSSLPKGATVSYRQAILLDFKVWPAPTDIPIADFDLATTIFKFHKDECLDEPVRTIDPYDDTHPIISVEFKRCAKK